MANITLIPSAKVPLVYDGENTMTTEWYRFFWNIYGFTGTGVVPVNKGGTGLDTIGDHQIIIGNSNNVFEPAVFTGSGINITYAPGIVNLAIGASGVTPGTYGSASQVGVFTVNQYGNITAASNTSIGIDADQIISGTIASARISGSYTGITGVGTLIAGTWNANTIDTAYGGTGLTSFTSGGALYATSTTTLTSGTLPVTAGGTGQTSYTNGQLLIGSTTGNTLTKATLTAGSGVTITNGAGSITISATGTGGTVTAVTGVAPIASSGGTTPAISISQSNTSTDGYLSSTDWNTFNSKAPGVTFTTNYVPYGQGTTTLNQSANLQFDGSLFTLNGYQKVSSIALQNYGAATNQYSSLLLNNTNVNFNGSTVYGVNGIVSYPQISHDATGGTSLVAIRGGLFSPVVTSAAITSPVNITGVTTSAVRNSSTDVSTNATNLLSGYIANYGHGTSLNSSASTATTLGFYAFGNTYTGTVSGMSMFYGSNNAIPASGSVTVGSMTGLYVVSPVIGTGAGTATVANVYGVRIQAPTVGANGTISGASYGIYQEEAAGKNYFNGYVGIGGVPSGSYKLEVIGTGSFTGNVTANGTVLTGNTGTVTSVAGTGTVNGLTLTGTVTTSGSLTLGGTLSGIGNSQLTNSTISGVALGGNLFNLTAGTGVSFSAGTTYNGSAAITINATSTGTVTSVAALTLGTTGTDLSSTVANGTTTPVITLNVPTASAANRGALSAADWSTFNGKQAALVSGTNIKTVGGVTLLGSGDVGTIGTGYGGTGLTSFTANRIFYASSTSVIAQSAGLTFDGTNFATTGSATATAFIPTSSTVPTNGMYLSAANTLSWGTNSTFRMSLDAAGTLSTTGAISSNTTVTATTTLKANLALGSGAGIDTSGQTGLVVGTASNALLITGSAYYLVAIAEVTQTGQNAVYVLGNGSVTLLGGTGSWVATTTTPGTTSYSIAYTGGNYRLYNGFTAAGTYTFKATVIKMS